MEINIENIKEVLSTRIQEFRSLDREKYSYKFMSRKTGLSPSYIERAAKGKLGDQLDAKKTMSLVGLICGPEETRLIARILVNGFINDSNQILKQALLEQFSKERNIENKEVEPNSSMGKAIAYMKNHWTGLTLFLKEAGVPLTNNDLERLLKRSVLNRKNAYFYRTEEGARIGDILMSTIETCVMNEINPWKYLLAIQEHQEKV